MTKDRWYGLSTMQWFYLVPPLSADLMAEFYTDLGLFFLATGELQLIFRETVLEHREAFGDWLSGVPERVMFEAVGRIPPDLERTFGPVIAGLFRTWCNQTFTVVPQDNPTWYCYQEVFDAWAKRHRRGLDIAELGEAGSVILEQYEAIVDGKALFDSFDRSANRPLSSWDDTLFSITPFTQDEASLPRSGKIGVYSAVTDTIFRNKFQIFWERHRELISGSFADKVRREAQNFADLNRQRLTKEHRFEIVAPQSLRRGLPLPPV